MTPKSMSYMGATTGTNTANSVLKLCEFDPTARVMQYVASMKQDVLAGNVIAPADPVPKLKTFCAVLESLPM